MPAGNTASGILAANAPLTRNVATEKSAAPKPVRLEIAVSAPIVRQKFVSATNAAPALPTANVEPLPCAATANVFSEPAATTRNVRMEVASIRRVTPALRISNVLQPMAEPANAAKARVVPLRNAAPIPTVPKALA